MPDNHQCDRGEDVNRDFGAAPFADGRRPKLLLDGVPGKGCFWIIFRSRRGWTGIYEAISGLLKDIVRFFRQIAQKNDLSLLARQRSQTPIFLRITTCDISNV
ncbi:hypothetical protein D3C87_1539610 [compost metagenome]